MRIECTIATKSITYHLVLTGKYNVLIGDSGAGKTRLANLCSTLRKGIQLLEPLQFNVYGASPADSLEFQSKLDEERGAIFVIDEDVLLSGGNSLCERILNSPNYFIFTVRDGIGKIPYSVFNVFELVDSRTERRMKQCFNTLNSAMLEHDADTPVLVEGSVLTFEVVQSILSARGYKNIYSVPVKSEFQKKMLQEHQRAIVIADLCSCGYEYTMWHLLGLLRGCLVCGTLSFEWELYRAYAGEPTSYDLSHILCSRTEEELYFGMLRILLRRLGVSYSKAMKFGDLPNKQALQRMYPKLHPREKSSSIRRMKLE